MALFLSNTSSAINEEEGGCVAINLLLERFCGFLIKGPLAVAGMSRFSRAHLGR